MRGVLNKEIENGSKTSKNMSLSYGVIFFWRKTKWMGAGISGGGPRGAHKDRGTPRGVGRALHPCGQLVRPSGVCSVREILKFSIKNHTKFSWHLENFYFWDIFLFHG